MSILYLEEEGTFTDPVKLDLLELYSDDHNILTKSTFTRILSKSII